jgi:predicted dinucleotide-binding enzyme
MKIGVLGTGVVGQTMAGKLMQMGHDVMMGARSADNAKVVDFVRRTGGGAGSFVEASAHGELVFNCTRGGASLEVLTACRAKLLGKVLVDVSNPIDFSHGFPPALAISNTDSLGEQIQLALPETHVIKTLNTMNAAVMVDPSRVPGRHTVFVSGEDKAAKGRVMDLLRSFGWHSIIDLGGISSARGVEQLLPLWTLLYGALGTGDFNIAVLRAPT